MIESADGFDWTNLGTTERKARTPHECYECGRTIQPGETYHRTAVVCDGRFEAYKHCGQCAIVADWLLKTCSGFLFGGVEDDLGEHWSEDYRCLDLGRLIVGMGRDWRGISVERVAEWERRASAHARRVEART